MTTGKCKQGSLASQKKICIRALETWGLEISKSQVELTFGCVPEHRILSIFNSGHLVLCIFLFVLLKLNEKKMLFHIRRQQPRGNKRVKKIYTPLNFKSLIALWAFMTDAENMCSQNSAGGLGQVLRHFTLFWVYFFRRRTLKCLVFPIHQVCPSDSTFVPLTASCQQI